MITEICGADGATVGEASTLSSRRIFQLSDAALDVWRAGTTRSGRFGVLGIQHAASMRFVLAQRDGPEPGLRSAIPECIQSWGG